MASSKAIISQKDARLKREQDKLRAQHLVNLIERKADDVKHAFFDIGAAWVELANNRLYLALGFATFADLVEASGVMGLSQAKKLMAVAELVPREDALRMGTEKAYAITRLTSLLPEGKPVKDVLREHDVINGQSVEQASTRDIEAAVERLRHNRAKARPNPEADAHHKLARESQAAFRRHGVRHAVVKAVRRKMGWRMVIEVPPAAMGDLLRG